MITKRNVTQLIISINLRFKRRDIFLFKTNFELKQSHVHNTFLPFFFLFHYLHLNFGIRAARLAPRFATASCLRLPTCLCMAFGISDILRCPLLHTGRFLIVLRYNTVLDRMASIFHPRLRNFLSQRDRPPHIRVQPSFFCLRIVRYLPALSQFFPQLFP